MKNLVMLAIIAVFVMGVCGCQNTKTRAVEGALIGGVLGAGAGYGIGQGSHHGAEGAGIGAAAGAVTGALVGSQINKPQANSQPANMPNPNQMSIQQIVDFTHQGVNENVIIDKIRLSNSRFTLSPQDVTYLKNQGVNERVINAMQGV
jgi:outer membrane lipoprotein SlyB